MGALDAINGRFGTWWRWRCRRGLKREWRMRSPAWTTDIEERAYGRYQTNPRQVAEDGGYLA
ncbi:DUF4113 domain-containing protein [Sphingomonas sp. R86521]|uniref:DUF4113 domain-containing protein n=1 Tax=Sphingomonas sp. R86521 TaxID=3093860 RepID=UPI0036D2DEE6